MDDIELFSHSAYRDQYHILFAPKDRWQIVIKMIGTDAGTKTKGPRVGYLKSRPDDERHANLDYRTAVGLLRVTLPILDSSHKSLFPSASPTGRRSARVRGHSPWTAGHSKS